MTTFISYSRVDSEFVVRLARDLKSAGYDIWLDQLDIAKGARWDDAIEAAVESSSTFMIVLAPESIESQNVKDELSYAIDSGKHILPVVIRPCKIPLRLRRFQYVDFTDKPYKDSLADIKRLLSNTQRLAKAPAEEPYLPPPTPAPVFTEPVIQREPEFAPQPLKQDEPKRAKPARKFIVPVVIAVIAVAAIVAGLAFAANRNASAPPSTTLTFTESLPTIAAADPSTPIPPPPQIIDDAGVTMRIVSAGEFTMGSDSGMADEKPVQTGYLETFYIDKYEVTNALYRACVDSGACPAPKKTGSVSRVTYYAKSEFDNYPVVYVDWNMARTYCEWRGARLPTEPEWEKAARGTDGRTYPWGEEISCNETNYFGCEGDTVSVTSYTAGLSVYGVYNMAGNVYEWVSTLYAPYPYDPTDGREDLKAPGERVIRGGSWLNADSDNEVRSARRHKADPLTVKENIGFRCALTAVIPETGPVPPTATPGNSLTATHLWNSREICFNTRDDDGDRLIDKADPDCTKDKPVTATLRPFITTIPGLITPSRTSIAACVPEPDLQCDPSAPYDPATCQCGKFVEGGCTDPDATNYDPDAPYDDGSCTYGPVPVAPVYGCTDAAATNYDPSATDDDGSCNYSPPPVYGCTDSGAENYNPNATEDDGSCTYAPAPVFGCTDPGATNYNPNATDDDGSCNYPPPAVFGCTDPAATNYNPNATDDDGSCTY